MTSAYRCDGCGEFREGSPDEMLYRQVRMITKTKKNLVSELCGECAAEFAEAFTLSESDDEEHGNPGVLEASE